MANICNRLLRYSNGQRALISLRNGNVVTGTIVGTFQNKVQVGFPLVVFNSSGANVLSTTNTLSTSNAVGTPVPFIEIFCSDIVAAAAGNIAVTVSTASTVTTVI